MAKYKVLKGFRDIETKEAYTANQEIEMTVKRADEAAKNLAEHGEFLERIEDKEVEAAEEVAAVDEKSKDKKEK